MGRAGRKEIPQVWSRRRWSWASEMDRDTDGTGLGTWSCPRNLPGALSQTHTIQRQAQTSTSHTRNTTARSPHPSHPDALRSVTADDKMPIKPITGVWSPIGAAADTGEQ